jgi:hypothetical protein
MSLLVKIDQLKSSHELHSTIKVNVVHFKGPFTYGPEVTFAFMYFLSLHQILIKPYMWHLYYKSTGITACYFHSV